MKRITTMLCTCLLMIMLMAGALAEPPAMVVHDFEEWSFNAEAQTEPYTGGTIYRSSGPRGPRVDMAKVKKVGKTLLFYLAACLIINRCSPDNKLVRILFLSCIFDRSKRKKKEQEGDIYDLSQYGDEPMTSEPDEGWENSDDDEQEGFGIDFDYNSRFDDDDEGNFDNDSE